MKPLVVDASAALALCLKDEAGALGSHVLEYISSADILVPPHWWIEVTNGLLFAVQKQRIKKQDVSACIDMLAQINPHIITLTLSDLSGSLFTLAQHHHLTIYDAYYLDIALHEDAGIATLDKALKKAARAENVSAL